jgi:tetratricopeptide (TPR) repeat protein
MSMSHVEESRRWSQTAIAALDGTSRGGRIEMRLQTLLGLSVIVAPGFANEGRIALTRALEIAEKLGDFESQLMLLGHLNNFAMVTLGDYRAAHDFALRCARIEEGLDATAVIRADSKLGSSYRYIGDLERAERHIRAALTRAAQRRASGSSNDSGVTTYLCDLASILWLRGYADQATEIGSRILKEVLDLGYPFVACIYLAGIIPYFIWIGDERLTTTSIERMLEITDTANFAGFRLQALAFKGAQLIGRGDSQEGIPLIRNALDDLPNALIKPVSSPLVAILANGLAGTGQNQAAIAALDKEIARIERDGDLIFMPDILRAKADILASMPDPDIPGAEDCLLRSLDLAGRQSALSWELRAATSLARLRHRQGQPDEARKILAPIFGRFTEGFDTLDLRTARRLLDELT